MKPFPASPKPLHTSLFSSADRKVSIFYLPLTQVIYYNPPDQAEDQLAWGKWSGLSLHTAWTLPLDYFPVVSTCETMGPKKCEQTKGNLSSHFPEDMVKLQKNHLKNICKCKEGHDNVNFLMLLTFENWFWTDKPNLTEPQVKWRDIFFYHWCFFSCLKIFLGWNVQYRWWPKSKYPWRIQHTISGKFSFAANSYVVKLGFLTLTGGTIS